MHLLSDFFTFQSQCLQFFILVNIFCDFDIFPHCSAVGPFINSCKKQKRAEPRRWQIKSIYFILLYSRLQAGQIKITD